MIFDKDTFGKYKIGAVVVQAINGLPSNIGHITGFTMNAQEVILLVKWADDDIPRGMHPANVEVLE